MKIEDVSEHMEKKTVIVHSGCRYYISGVISRIKKGKWFYEIELHDLKANSVTVVNLEDIKEK